MGAPAPAAQGANAEAGRRRARPRAKQRLSPLRTCGAGSSGVPHPLSSMGRTHIASVLMAAGSWWVATSVDSADWKRSTTSGSTSSGQT
jgi:hypothetical protein